SPAAPSRQRTCSWCSTPFPSRPSSTGARSSTQYGVPSTQAEGLRRASYRFALGGGTPHRRISDTTRQLSWTLALIPDPAVSLLRHDLEIELFARADHRHGRLHADPVVRQHAVKVVHA